MNQKATKKTTCPSCGEAATGRFCTHCGAALAARSCSKCQATLSPRARFCHACGMAAGGPTTRVSRTGGFPLPWAVAAVCVIVVALVIVVRPSTPSQPGQSAGVPQSPSGAPDISTLSPRQQADRLFDLIMTSAEAGDTARVAFHTDMAIQAYQLIGDLDGDARYHVGLIHVVRGETAAALAQADSLEAMVPGHLLALVLRRTAARASGDTTALPDIYRAFLASYEREIAAPRPEYEMHRNSIDSFLSEARAATASGN
ncbi:MAG: zinc ribbon domain-containing protein [Gemmatimonadota bacterium]|nr:MAG: zinc ribbon domain-containing protein [Gemmatimonadota bacterium]